jgi:hypothetical protein
LLEFFLRHPGRVLTRSQIIEAIWDFAYVGGSNVVDQYVNYLRRTMPRSAGVTWRRSGAWVTGCAKPDPGSRMPIRLRLAVAFGVIAPQRWRRCRPGFEARSCMTHPRRLGHVLVHDP